MIKIYSSLRDKIGEETEITSILKRIGKDDSFIRNYLRNIDDKKEYKEQKRKLQVFTPNGFFDKDKTINSLLESSGYIYIDIDGISDIDEVKSILGCDKYIYSLWKSVSGKGLGGLVKIASNIDCDTFKTYYKFIEKYIYDTYEYKLDNACSNINRLTFISSDSNIIINNESEIFNISDFDYEFKSKKEKKTKKIKMNGYNYNHKDYPLKTLTDTYRYNVCIEDFKDEILEELSDDVYENGEYFLYHKGLPIPNLFIGKKNSWYDGVRNKYFIPHMLGVLTLNPNIDIDLFCEVGRQVMLYAFKENWDSDFLVEKCYHIYNSFCSGDYESLNYSIKKVFYKRESKYTREEKISITKKYLFNDTRHYYERMIDKKIEFVSETTNDVLNDNRISKVVEFDGLYSKKKLKKYRTPSHTSNYIKGNLSLCGLDENTKLGVKTTNVLIKLLKAYNEMIKDNLIINKSRVSKYSGVSYKTVRKYWDILEKTNKNKQHD